MVSQCGPLTDVSVADHTVLLRGVQLFCAETGWPLLLGWNLVSDFKIEGWVEPGFYLFLKGVDGPVVPICHMHVQNISLMGCDLAYFLASGLDPSLKIRSKSHHNGLRYLKLLQ